MSRQQSPLVKGNILSAARQVFADRGYKEATVREIARRAGVAVGGLYPYFGNKERLYIEALEQGTKLYRKGIRELEHEEPAVAIRRYIENHLEYTVSRKQAISLQFKDYDLEFARPFRTGFFRFQKEFLAGIIRRGVEQGIFRAADCEDAALFILCVLKGAVFNYLAGTADLAASRDTLWRSVLTFLKQDEPGGETDPGRPMGVRPGAGRRGRTKVSGG